MRLVTAIPGRGNIGFDEQMLAQRNKSAPGAKATKKPSANKRLAQNNKSRTGGKATKKRNRQ